MATWTWILVGLSVLAAVQIWVLRAARKRRQGDGDASSGPSGARSTASRAPKPFTGIPPPGDDDRAADGPVVCPNCGTENDPRFDYCEECVAPLR